MKPKHLIIFSVIFALLAAAVMLRQAQRPVELVSNDLVKLDFSFDKTNVSRIEMIKHVPGISAENADYIELVQDNDEWVVSTSFNAFADQTKINNLLDEINKTRGEQRANDKDLYADFGIGDNASFQVKISNAMGNELLNFRLGTKNAGPQSLFIRKDKSAQIFLSDANLFGAMGLYGDPAEDSLNHHYWVDTRLFRFEKDKIKHVEIRRLQDGVISAAVSKSEETQKWQFDQAGLAFDADGGKIGQFLDTLLAIRGKGVLDPSAQHEGFSTPFLQVILKLQDGEDAVLLAGSQNGETQNHAVQVSGQSALIEVSKYYIENMNIDHSRFYPVNILNVNPSENVNLKVKTAEGRFEWTDADEPSSGLKAYLKDLKELEIKGLARDAAVRKRASSPSNIFLEFRPKDGEAAVILDIGKTVSEESQDRVAQLRGHEEVFILDASHYRKLFEDTDRLVKELPAS